MAPNVGAATITTNSQWRRNQSFIEKCLNGYGRVGDA